MRKSTRDNPDQLALFSITQYERVITEASIDCDGYEQKSTPVPRSNKERVYFSEVEITAGDTFTFNTDYCPYHTQIVNRELNGEIATIASIDSPTKPGTVELVFSCGRKLYIEADRLPEFGYSKSTPVPRSNKERVYFWVESYLMHQRYLHYRYCYLQKKDGIERTVKIHIPGRGLSIRQGRAERVRDAIAEGLSPEAIALLIKEWKR